MTTIQAADGVALHLRHWPLPADPVRGNVLIVHGLGEHGGRYEHVAAHLASGGWACLGYDQRGHGLSGGPRGGMPNDDSLLSDLARVIDHVRAARTSSPPSTMKRTSRGVMRSCTSGSAR